MALNKFKVIVTKLFCIAFLLSCSDDSGDSENIVPITTGNSSPNIVLIIADDVGWDAFGDYSGANGTKANTPTLDSLAMNGITFQNFWTNPTCAPTRASMLTGKYAFRHGVGGVQVPQQATLKANETIIQNQIGDKYATAVIGKWHVNSASQLNAPEDFGVDFYSGIFLGAARDYYDWTQTSSGMQQNITTYATTHFVDQSVNWIQQQTSPFFLWLAFNAPHTPFHRPPLNLISDQSLSDNQATINANPLPYYLASIEAMDKEIARLISSMTTTQRENTVFIFMGDNGTPREVSQSPFLASRVKATLFQGGVNAPLIVCGKNVSRRNELESALIQTPDMFATIADIAGSGSNTSQDGISFKPLFTDANATKRTFAYTEQFGNLNTANDGYTIRNESYKLIYLENGTEYLYQIDTDLFEQTNLFNSSLSSVAQQNLDALRQIKANL